MGAVGRCILQARPKRKEGSPLRMTVLRVAGKAESIFEETPDRPQLQGIGAPLRRLEDRRFLLGAAGASVAGQSICRAPCTARSCAPGNAHRAGIREVRRVLQQFGLRPASSPFHRADMGGPEGMATMRPCGRCCFERRARPWAEPTRAFALDRDGRAASLGCGCAVVRDSNAGRSKAGRAVVRVDYAARCHRSPTRPVFIRHRTPCRDAEFDGRFRTKSRQCGAPHRSTA